MPFVARKQNNHARVGQANNLFADVTAPASSRSNVALGTSMFDVQHTSARIAADAANATDVGDIVDGNDIVTLATGPEGSRFVTADISGVQVAMQVPPIGLAIPEEAAVCEFPAQALQLQRQISITNTTPQIVDVQTDVCGNVISYTENMTRNMVAGGWTAISGLEAGVNGIANLEVNANGGIFDAQNPNIFLANSLSQPAFGPDVNVTTNPNMRVGKKRGYGVPNHNVNAGYGASMMRKFRSA